MKRKNISTGFGIASLITSIIGFMLFIMPYFGIFFSITGIVLSEVQKTRQKTGIATAGLVIGILGVISNLLWLLAIVLFMSLGLG